MAAVEIYNTDYNLVQFRAADQSAADAVKAWAKKAYPDAKLILQPMDGHVSGRAQLVPGLPGKQNFEANFGKALRAYIATLD